MHSKKPEPGVSRDNRIDDAGLERLEQHLKCGSKMQVAVLKQWIKRYGESARVLIKQYGQYSSAMD